MRSNFKYLLTLCVLCGIPFGATAAGQSAAIDQSAMRAAEREVSEQHERYLQEKIPAVNKPPVRSRKASARGQHPVRTAVVDQGGSYVVTDAATYAIYRTAVVRGYQEGYSEGRQARLDRRGSRYDTSETYQAGTVGYDQAGDRNGYRYYFQQAFARGFGDGYNDRLNAASADSGTSALDLVVREVLGYKGN